MVPNGDAITCARQRADTPGCCAISAPRSWNPICVGSNRNASVPIMNEAGLRFINRRVPAMTTTTPRNPPDSQSGDLQQCDGIFYGPINLAKALRPEGPFAQEIIALGGCRRLGAQPGGGKG